MRLHVTPHVREPPELLPVFEQHVIPFIFLICTYRQQKSAKPKGKNGALCFKAVANPLQCWVLPTENHAVSSVVHMHMDTGAVCRPWDKGVPGAYLCGRISLRSPGWRWNLGLKFSAYSGCSVKPVWMKGKRNAHIQLLCNISLMKGKKKNAHFSCSVTFLCALLVPSSVWRGITGDGAKALLSVEWSSVARRSI